MPAAARQCQQRTNEPCLIHSLCAACVQLESKKFAELSKLQPFAGQMPAGQGTEPMHVWMLMTLALSFAQRRLPLELSQTLR